MAYEKLSVSRQGAELSFRAWRLLLYIFTLETVPFVKHLLEFDNFKATSSLIFMSDPLIQSNPRLLSYNSSKKFFNIIFRYCQKKWELVPFHLTLCLSVLVTK